jgi:hypothetical protein
MEETPVGEPPLTEEEPTGPTNASELAVLALASLIDQFEKGLDEKEATKAFFIAPNGEAIDVEGFGAHPLDLLYFEGTDADGRKTMAVVPSGAAALTLKAVPVDDVEEPRRVGFRINDIRPADTPPDV